jgi:hypothetical protein
MTVSWTENLQFILTKLRSVWLGTSVLRTVHVGKPISLTPWGSAPLVLSCATDHFCALARWCSLFATSSSHDPSVQSQTSLISCSWRGPCYNDEPVSFAKDLVVSGHVLGFMLKLCFVIVCVTLVKLCFTFVRNLQQWEPLAACVYRISVSILCCTLAR